MDRKNIEKIAHTPEDRLLLAKVWDKINSGIRKNIPASTCFLSPRELEMCRYLFGDEPGLLPFGGYEEAERKMLCWLPEYLDESALYDDDSPMVCIRATFWQGDTPSLYLNNYALSVEFAQIISIKIFLFTKTELKL